MAAARAFQSYTAWAAATGTAWALLVGVSLGLAARDPAQDLRHPAVVVTAWGFVGAWAVAGGLMLRARPGDWAPPGDPVRLARLAWTLGLATHAVHVVLAFGLAHGWSHAAAVRHVAAAGGFGEGIVVSYLFAATWAGDAAWWWANPHGYAKRPRRVRYAVHGFLAFVTFNATVVFGTPWAQVAGAAAFVALAVLWRRPANGFK